MTITMTLPNLQHTTARTIDRNAAKWFGQNLMNLLVLSNPIRILLKEGYGAPDSQFTALDVLQ